MEYGKTLLTVGGLFCLTSFNAHAALSVTTNGLGVYDSGLNATWTQDANLLGTLEGVYQSAGYNTVVQAIINASGGVIHDTPNNSDGTYYQAINLPPYSGKYNLTTSDFGSGGTMSWWGAQAFVHYLDSINYGGSNQWTLPTSDAVYYYSKGSQLGELFYNELGGALGSPFPSGPFSNVQSYGQQSATIPDARYWFANEYTDPNQSWQFDAYIGNQGWASKRNLFYAWAISPGPVSAVPIPGAVWLFGTGLLGLLGLKRRRHAG